MNCSKLYSTNELYHFGVKGMHWGVRRYQNQDGSYTSKGRGRYDNTGESSKKSSRKSKLKKAAKIGAGAAAAGLAAYGAYRLAKSGKLGAAASVVKRKASRSVNSAQYHATKIKNELAYRRATRKPIGKSLKGLSGPTSSRFQRASYRVRGAGSKAKMVGSKVTDHIKNPRTKRGRWAKNFTVGFGKGAAVGSIPVLATVGAAAVQGHRANKRYKKKNKARKGR